MNADFKAEKDISATLIRVDNAYEALAKLLQLVEMTKAAKVGVEPMSYVAPSAKVGEEAYIAAFAYVSERAVIGNKCKIYPHVFIGENVKIGNNVTLYSGVKIYADCKVGDNAIIHAGAIIGSD